MSGVADQINGTDRKIAFGDPGSLFGRDLDQMLNVTEIWSLWDEDAADYFLVNGQMQLFVSGDELFHFLDGW